MKFEQQPGESGRQTRFQIETGRRDVEGCSVL
jgi:hypothetical protein